MFRSAWKLAGDQLCAKGSVVDSRTGRVPDTCSGDSGGGLVAQRFDDNFVLLGVVSFGESECGARDGRPGVYTNLLSHLGWLREVTEVPGRSRLCTTEDGRPCQLPFTFRGVRYSSCTREHDREERLWCSTKTDPGGRHVQAGGHWGHCSESCQAEGRQEQADNEISQKLESQQISALKSWSVWTEWSVCSKSCGGGKTVRYVMLYI